MIVTVYHVYRTTFKKKKNNKKSFSKTLILPNFVVMKQNCATFKKIDQKMTHKNTHVVKTVHVPQKHNWVQYPTQ